MDTSDLPSHRRRVSRRALLGWGIASGIGFALSRVLCILESPCTSFDLYTYEGQTGALAWSPDGTKIAAGINHTVQIWESTSGRRLLTYAGHPQHVLSVSWSPDNTRLVSVGLEGSMQVWQTSDGKPLWVFPDPPPLNEGILACAAWSPDGTFIAATGVVTRFSEESTTTLWDAARGTLVRGYPDRALYTQRVAWSPGSTHLATGGYNQSLAVWHANSSQKIWDYQGDAAYVYGLAWSPNGKFIASGGTDQIVQVWDARTGEHLLTYRGHADQPPMPEWAYPYAIRALAWAPDSTRLASSAISGPIHVWKISEGKVGPP